MTTQDITTPPTRLEVAEDIRQAMNPLPGDQRPTAVPKAPSRLSELSDPWNSNRDRQSARNNPVYPVSEQPGSQLAPDPRRKETNPDKPLPHPSALDGLSVPSSVQDLMGSGLPKIPVSEARVSDVGNLSPSMPATAPAPRIVTDKGR